MRNKHRSISVTFLIVGIALAFATKWYIGFPFILIGALYYFKNQ